MDNMHNWYLPSLAAGWLVLAASCDAIEPAAAEAPAEFRAAWVATVANIDWPSRPGLSADQQKQELLAILDRAAELKLNALVFQVRPAADALYRSSLEPWSPYLTGAMGQAPEPDYDPLEMAVAEAHARGIQLHAWFNPYRAGHPSGNHEPSADHISKTHPELVREYGKYLWLDPGEPEAVKHSLAVMLDVVERYDIDGVHMDDYFYPYPIRDDAGQIVPFPDAESYERSGTTLERDDWRRQNVDRFVRRLYRRVKAKKPHVLVGISPFGIWRPGHPEGIVGFDQYASLYADARKWLRRGWVDYFAPQLYWTIDSPGQSYPKLLAWWSEQNVQDRHLWPGLFTSRVASKANGNWPVEEIKNQIELTREAPGATGHIHFSMKAIMKNQGGVADMLEKLYDKPAKAPASPWLEE